MKKKIERGKVSRVSFGIRAFDALIEGGFESGSSNYVGGITGTGKTIFGIQFLAEGVRKGEKCLFISFEERRNTLFSYMEKLGFDLEKFEKEKKFFLLEFTPHKVKKMLDEGGGAIEEIVVSNKISRVVIDDASSFTNLFKNDLEKKEATMALFNMFRSWGCTLLFLCEDKFDGEGDNLRSFDLGTDSVIYLYLKKGRLQRERFLEISKMRGTNHSMKIHKFKIGKNGINMGGSAHKKNNKNKK